MEHQRAPDIVQDPDLLGPQIDIKAILASLRRRRWIILGVFVASVAIGAVITIRAPRIYQASALVLVEPRTPQVLANVAEVYNLGAPHFWLSEEYYETQKSIIKGQPVAEKVVALLGLSPTTLAEQICSLGDESLENRVAGDVLAGLPAPLRTKVTLLGLEKSRSRAELVKHLEGLNPVPRVRSKVKVERVKESRLLRISIEDTDPQRAARLANAVADAYEEVNLDKKTDATRSASDWLTDQSQELKQRLTDSEMDLYEYKKENNIISVSLEDRQSMISQSLESLNQRLAETKADRLALESQRDRIRRALAADEDTDIFITGGEDMLIQNLKAARSELLREQADMTVKYTEQHPKAVAVRDKLQLVTDELNREIDKAIRKIEEQYLALRDTERRLTASIEELKEEAFELNKKEIGFNRLQREMENNKALYGLVLRRQKETDLSEGLRVNNVSKYESATPPGGPIRPKPGMNMLAAIMLGLIGGIGLALLVDYLDSSIKSQEQVENLGLPMLGLVPAIKKEAKKDADLSQGDKDRFIVAHPRSNVAECCRTIRTNLTFMSPENPARKLMVTSSGPREGKTTTIMNLGVTMASSGKRTLIVDTDMRRPRIHKSFGIHNDAGISTVLLGELTLDQAIQPSGIDGLDILPCGPIPPAPAELLTIERFGQVVEELTERYDRVLFDSPPVSAVSDPLVVASSMDGVVLVVLAGRTSYQALKSAVRMLQAVGGRLLGAILNDVDVEHGSTGYYYYNYYYYSDREKEKSGEAA